MTSRHIRAVEGYLTTLKLGDHVNKINLGSEGAASH